MLLTTITRQKVKKRLEILPITSEYLRAKFLKEEPIDEQEAPRTIIENELLQNNNKEDSKEEIYEEVNSTVSKYVQISTASESQIKKTPEDKERERTHITGSILPHYSRL